MLRLVVGLYTAAFWVGGLGEVVVFCLVLVAGEVLRWLSGSVLACLPHYGVGFGVCVLSVWCVVMMWFLVILVVLVWWLPLVADYG